MGRPKTDLEDRIVEAADRLFYERGYTNTGVQDIVTAARTNKPGFYNYFSTKEELARRYVTDRSEAMTAIIARAAEGSTDLPDFVRRWMGALKSETREGGLTRHGCGVANFAQQTDRTEQPMQKFMSEVTRRWLARTTAYIRSGVRDGRFPTAPGAGDIARRIFLVQEGALTMYRLSGSTRYFDEAAEMFEAWLSAQAPR